MAGTFITSGLAEDRIRCFTTGHTIRWNDHLPLLMKFIEDVSAAYAQNRSLGGYDISEVWDASSIYIVPMVNPDGIELVLSGLSPDNPNYSRKLIQWNNGSTDFSDNWQANNRGVDLNHNYNAGWRDPRRRGCRGITGPGPTRYSVLSGIRARGSGDGGFYERS